MTDLKSFSALTIQDEFGSYCIVLTTGARWTIGRDHSNVIVLPDHWVSRIHAMVYRNASGGFYLADLGSCNGSFVNGDRIQAPVLLRSGDRLSFGKTQVQFHSTSPLIADSVSLGTNRISSQGESVQQTLPDMELSRGSLLMTVTRQSRQRSLASFSGQQLQQQYQAGERNFPQCDLQGVDLSQLDLRQINLSQANLRGANLSQTNLQGANLGGADLSAAILQDTDLSGAILVGVNLEDANLDWVILTGAILDQELIEFL